MASAVVLALFARQTTAQAPSSCRENRADGSAAAGVNMAHEHHGSPRIPSPNVPVSGQSSGREHSVADTACRACSACVVAVMNAPLLTVVPRPVRPPLFPAETDGPLSLALEPVVPPP